MARVFLCNPPTSEVVRTPLLSFLYLAAALRRAGHQVALLDASAPRAPKTTAAIAEHIAAFAPDLVGIHIKTLYVQPAYALAAALAKDHVLVAGGPHATVCPEEPLHHGYTYVLRGEAEESLCELADAIDGKRRLEEIRGLGYRSQGGLYFNEERGFLLELDGLAPPLSALELFDAGHYELGAGLTPSGLLSSRGCPAACTFCSNNVTGRRFRYRSKESVASEIAELKQRVSPLAFCFFDDSFAVGRRRVDELCTALEPLMPIHWTCTAHPAHLDRETLSRMKAAGLAGVDIGMESADPAMLLRIGKGVTVERVLRVLTDCRELGIHSVVNLMFGWPDETDEELEATIEFMERARELAGGFNARGVVVPYPGTQIYDLNHRRFGFTKWWLSEPPLDYPPFPTAWSEPEIRRCYAADPALLRNFFRHPPHRLRRIQDALDKKAELTLRTLTREPAVEPTHKVPAAGAR